MTKEASQQCFHKKYIISQSRPTNISATVAAAKASCNSCSQWGGCISEDCSKCSEQTGPELALALPAPSDLIQIILDLYFKIQVSQERVRERERQTDRRKLVTMAFPKLKEESTKESTTFKKKHRPRLRSLSPFLENMQTKALGALEN